MEDFNSVINKVDLSSPMAAEYTLFSSSQNIYKGRHIGLQGKSLIVKRIKIMHSMLSVHDAINLMSTMK